MRDGVNDWVQEGQLFVWRYARPNCNYGGWHLTADPTGCRSVRNLLDGMNAGEPCHRTLALERVTDRILSVPNHGQKTAGHYGKLRIAYRPGFDALQLCPEGERLTMTVGNGRIRKLSAAFAEIEVGGGDFSIATSDDCKAESWMFWWMLGIDYHRGKRS